MDSADQSRNSPRKLSLRQDKLGRSRQHSINIKYEHIDKRYLQPPYGELVMRISISVEAIKAICIQRLNNAMG